MRLNTRHFGAVAFIVVACIIVRALPSLAPIRAPDLVQQSQAIQFRDRSGLALGSLLSRDQEHTAAVALSGVSPSFIQAVLAAEDSRFYNHGAVDYRSLARATWQLGRTHRIVSGASTITMQLARMIRPQSGGWVGKLWQIWTAWRLEAGLTKQQILEAYLNRVPMGGNVYGVEAAARVYLGLPASGLDLAQASLLAAIPNDPSGLEPHHHWQALKLRQAYVLQRMLADGFIDDTRRRRALEEQIWLQPRAGGIVAAPHLLFWLANKLPSGLTQVQTTIDRPLQSFVEAQVRQVIGELGQRNVHHAAVLVVDNRSGAVLAYVGSPDYFADNESGRNDGVQALRQPGSALKPFLYELALETRALHPNTILADAPAHYAIPGGLLYSPSDYSNRFLGPVRVRIALADSLNVPAVRTLAAIGVPPFLERLHELGFRHLTRSPDYYGLGLTLGGGEVSLWELTQAYVTLARQGSPLPLRAIISGLPGSESVNTIPRLANEVVDEPNPTAAWMLITDILSDPHARAKAFGLGSVLDLPFAAAVKTGTSSDYRDTWTIGFTHDYTVGVWVGNFDGEPMRQVSGVTGAAPLWSRIMLHLHERADPAAFPAPKGLVLEPICAVTGLRPSNECQAVVYEYLYPQDLAAYFAPLRHPVLDTAFDGWLAAQQIQTPDSGFKILFPHQGDVFALYPRHDGFLHDWQALKFQANNPGARMRWWLNGNALSQDKNGELYWQLQPGTWRLRAAQGAKVDVVTFRVIRAQQRMLRPGFSLAGQPRAR